MMLTFEYPPPFDGNYTPVTIIGEWVEMEGNDVRVDIDDSGDPVTVATRELIPDTGDYIYPGKMVAVWRLADEYGGGIYGRMVMGAGTHAVADERQ